MTQIVSYGGGTNSTAMLIEMMLRGEPCDAIVFADTGGERPETYTHVAEFSEWLQAQGYPAITTVQNDGMHETLEQECLTNHRLPSVVFGFASCSDKYKRRPFAKWLKAQQFDGDVTVCIGFDADEPHRADRGSAKKDPFKKRYPLIEWDMGRAECITAIRNAGVTAPGKSACFFCPNSKKHEILQLRKDHPDLLLRAFEIEENAESTAMAGLGRAWSWRSYIDKYEAQGDLFCGFSDRFSEMPCGCHDG